MDTIEDILSICDINTSTERRWRLIDRVSERGPDAWLKLLQIVVGGVGYYDDHVIQQALLGLSDEWARLYAGDYGLDEQKKFIRLLIRLMRKSVPHQKLLQRVSKRTVRARL